MLSDSLFGPISANNRLGELEVIEEIQLDDSERTPCEIWTRVMGYHRPNSAFNPGKLSEYKERKHFVEEKSGNE